MKKSFVFMAMLLVSFTLAAQDKEEKDPKEAFFQARVKEMVYRLDIKDEQKSEFVKVYKQYSEDIRQVVGQMRPDRPAAGRKAKSEQPADNRKAEKPQLSMEEAVKIEKDKIARQQKVQNIKLRYIDEFAKILTPQQLGKFFNAENQIQQKLRSRQQQRPGKGQGVKQRPSRPGAGRQKPANEK